MWNSQEKIIGQILLLYLKDMAFETRFGKQGIAAIFKEWYYLFLTTLLQELWKN